MCTDWVELSLQRVAQKEERAGLMRADLRQRRLARLFDGWAAYAAAMQAEPHPGEAFGSPRSGQVRATWMPVQKYASIPAV